MSERDSSESKIAPEKLLHSVDHVLSEYCKIEQHLNFIAHSSDNLLTEGDSQRLMRSDKIALHELSFNLWERALITSLGSITNNYFPHYQIVQKFVNYALNARFVDFGLLTNFFSKLLYLHPPNTFKMQEYYWSILNDKYIMLNENKIQEKNLFWCLIEAILSCLKNQESLEGFEEKFLETEDETNYRDTLKFLHDLHKKTSIEKALSINKNAMIYFDTLSPSDKFLRILILLKYISDVLESDLLFRKSINQLRIAKNNRSFLSCLFWENVNETGAINKNVKKLICAYKLAQEVNWCENLVTQKLLALLAEEIRLEDAVANPIYPFLGNHSIALADKMSSKLFQSSQNKNKTVNVQSIQELKPHWLRLLVCSSLLNHITGKSCPPDLKTVCNILNFLASVKNGKKLQSICRSTEMDDLKIDQTSFALQNNKKKIKYDSTKCNSLCRLGSGRIRRITSFCQFNLNAINDKGWAPLHEAVLNGHEECVEALLNYRPRQSEKRVDTRIKGVHNFTPLMCAIVKEHSKICQLLLHHSGSSLLEDVNDDNETPMDMCRSEKIARLLKNYDETTLKLQKCETLGFDANDSEVIIELCAEMVLSYFITYRTWDVFRLVKMDFPSESMVEKIADRRSDGIKWDYSRYKQDLEPNIHELKTLVLKILKEKDLNQKTLNSLKNLLRILNFAKL